MSGEWWDCYTDHSVHFCHDVAVHGHELHSTDRSDSEGDRVGPLRVDDQLSVGGVGQGAHTVPGVRKNQKPVQKLFDAKAARVCLV